MRELFFFVKSLILTVIVVMLMQIEVGDNTVEQKAMMWIESSPIVSPLREAAEGGAKLVRQGWKQVAGAFDKVLSDGFKRENLSGSRDVRFRLERSKKVLEENAKKTAEGVKDAWSRPAEKKSKKDYSQEEPQWGP